MGASVLNRDGKEVTPIMGCYGIGIERILTAAIESSAAANDGKSLCPPPGHRSLSGRRHHHQHRRRRPARSRRKGRRRPQAAGLDVLLDDRDERAGVKFKDADLVGIPYRINIGRGVAEGKVELVDRLKLTNQDHSID